MNKTTDEIKPLNRANYSSPDQIGSSHWFMTLMSQVNNMALYIRNNENIKPYLLEQYGRMISNIALDMIDWRNVNNIPALHIDSCVKKLREHADQLESFKEQCKED